MRLALHHVAVTASDLERSTAFYEGLGLRATFEWEAPDGSRRLRQMSAPSGGIVELFAYPAATPAVDREHDTPGLKHLAFSTPDVRATLADLQARGLASADVEVVENGAGLVFCFIADPDGVPVELTQV